MATQHVVQIGHRVEVHGAVYVAGDIFETNDAEIEAQLVADGVIEPEGAAEARSEAEAQIRELEAHLGEQLRERRRLEIAMHTARGTLSHDILQGRKDNRGPKGNAS